MLLAFQLGQGGCEWLEYELPASILPVKAYIDLGLLCLGYPVVHESIFYAGPMQRNDFEARGTSLGGRRASTLLYHVHEQGNDSDENRRASRMEAKNIR